MTSEPAPSKSGDPPASSNSMVRPFDAEEQLAFVQEDGQAGKMIASLLCFFFLYTLLVTSVAAWWTWAAIY